MYSPLPDSWAHFFCLQTNIVVNTSLTLAFLPLCLEGCPKPRDLALLIDASGESVTFV